MNLLDDYNEKRQAVFDYFGYKEDWVVIPLDDATECFWRLEGEGPGTVHYADSEAELEDECGNYYRSAIYTQRFLPKWVYRGADYTMVAVDTHMDGNKFLMIFTNRLERPLTSKAQITVPKAPVH